MPPVLNDPVLRDPVLTFFVFFVVNFAVRRTRRPRPQRTINHWRKKQSTATRRSALSGGRCGPPAWHRPEVARGCGPNGRPVLRWARLQGW